MNNRASELKRAIKKRKSDIESTEKLIKIDEKDILLAKKELDIINENLEIILPVQEGLKSIKDLSKEKYFLIQTKLFTIMAEIKKIDKKDNFNLNYKNIFNEIDFFRNIRSYKEFSEHLSLVILLLKTTTTNLEFLIREISIRVRDNKESINRYRREIEPYQRILYRYEQNPSAA